MLPEEYFLNKNELLAQSFASFSQNSTVIVLLPYKPT